MVDTCLLSYPRSGNTWARYIIEVLTGKPSKGYDSKNDRPIGQRVDLGIDTKAEPVVEKSHKIHAGHKYNKLIVLVRNYKDCMIRHGGAEPGRIPLEKKVRHKFDTETQGRQARVDYIEILQDYDAYEGEKLLVYYEDLLEYPKHEILRIAQFFGVPESRVDEFMQEYDRHFAGGLSSYHDKSFTKGKNVNHHRTRVSAELLTYMTNDLKKRHPEIFEKYLKRYF